MSFNITVNKTDNMTVNKTYNMTVKKTFHLNFSIAGEKIIDMAENNCLIWWKKKTIPWF